jgi:hypothetical protein
MFVRIALLPLESYSERQQQNRMVIAMLNDHGQLTTALFFILPYEAIIAMWC